MQHLPRGGIDEAALALLERHGAQILATARRYAATPEDAEDAYQRAFEILLRRRRLRARTSSSRGSRRSSSTRRSRSAANAIATRR